MTEVCVQARGTCAEIEKTNNKSSEKCFSGSYNLSSKSDNVRQSKNYCVKCYFYEYIILWLILYQCFGSDKIIGNPITNDHWHILCT